jgi:hydrogenase maturation protease
VNLTALDQIAKAVLYEGYLLYPYRPSAVKNQQRWNFGVLYPQPYSDAQCGTDAWTMQTECLVQAGPLTELEVRVRFLHLMERSEHQSHGTETLSSWQEAVEREVRLPVIGTCDLREEPLIHAFSFPEEVTTESVRSVDDGTTGAIVRRQKAVRGAVEITATPCGEELLKLCVRVHNQTPLEMTPSTNRDQALMKSLVSTHTLLGLQDGAFISLLDPPAAVRDIAESCLNAGTWPVLVGEEGTHDTMISSPIILYDYPQIAPESTGDLFDGTEIDEILSLRIMTLTDEEKKEIRRSDERARQILERTDNVPDEQLMKLHGVLRGMRPLKEESE